MIGAIFGDVVGSLYERRALKTTRFPLFGPGSVFTDDTVMTIATAEALLSGEPYDRAYRRWGRRHPNAGYGGAFRQWLRTENAPSYNSWGNGSAMRVSPVAFVHDTLDAVLTEAERSASVTHDHPEGIKGAQAAAMAVLLVRGRTPKEEIRRQLTERFGYELSRTLAEIRPAYTFDVSSQGSVPEALIAFLETDDSESAIRAAVSLGGDADTQAAIAGAAAVAWDGGVSEPVRTEIMSRLPEDMRDVLTAFEARFCGQPPYESAIST